MFVSNLISLVEDKVDKFITTAHHQLQLRRPKIRQVAVLIGIMIAYTSAIIYGQTHIKSLEIDFVKFSVSQV